MPLLDRGVAASSTEADGRSPTREWIVAAVLYGLVAAVGIRDGGFWPEVAFVALSASIVVLLTALIANLVDRRSARVLVSLLLLALWWFIRAIIAGTATEFLPLGASIVAFVAAFAAVRPLRRRAREVAGLGAACLGAAGAVVGFVGLIWRWYPIAIPTQELWRLSSTLTYSDAAGLVLGVCLLLALGSDAYPCVTRVVVSLCAGGLLATQSRGAYVAFACACVIVPWRRYAHFCVPLLAGGALGVAAIVSSPDVAPVPWLGVVLVLAICVAALVRRDVFSIRLGHRGRVVAGLLLLAGVAGVVLLIHHELALRALAPSNHDRVVEWSTALHQWRSAPVLGVGPDHLLVFRAIDGSYASFVHNEYLQIAADSGAIGLVLLAFSAICVTKVVRRFDAILFLRGPRPWCAGRSRGRSTSTGISPSLVSSADGALDWRRRGEPEKETSR